MESGALFVFPVNIPLPTVVYVHVPSASDLGPFWCSCTPKTHRARKPRPLKHPDGRLKPARPRPCRFGVGRPHKPPRQRRYRT